MLKPNLDIIVKGAGLGALSYCLLVLVQIFMHGEVTYIEPNISVLIGEIIIIGSLLILGLRDVWIYRRKKIEGMRNG